MGKVTASGRANLSFRERALAEAARYGSDSWVFLRELLQNARDAGARRVEIEVTQEGSLERISCRDDGGGMSAFHAHRYLFALYASSKEYDIRQAGQFGVGFWSVLRFKPDRVVIRSRERQGVPWQVELNHRLENAVFTSCRIDAGTEIVLERHRMSGSRARAGKRSRPLADKVFDAVYRYGRFLTRRDSPAPLEIRVNGRSANAGLSLPAPSSTFHRRGFRGAVALGAEARVELFANGLFVRQAACLEDLVDDRDGGELEEEGSSLDLPGSLAPQVVLDSSELEVLLARSDVRQTRHLRRMVRTAEKELERLIERQLEALRPQPWYVLLAARLRELRSRMRDKRLVRTAGWLVPAVVAGIVLGWWMAGWTARGPAEPWPAFDLRAEARGAAGYGRDAAEGLHGYTDFGRAYREPWVDPPSRGATPIPLTYQPPERELFFAALVVEDPTVPANREPEPAGIYRGTSCPVLEPKGCVAVRLRVDDVDFRIPVPTGHLLDPDSVRLDGAVPRIAATAHGEPLVMGARPSGVLQYRTGPARMPATFRPSLAVAEPGELAEVAARFANLPLERRVDEAVDWVASHVAYDRSNATRRATFAGRRAGRGFVETHLAVGKGDCDVQNGLLAVLLREAGVPARLAVGLVGEGGRVAPSPHGWVEYLDTDRRWQVADVSARFVAAGPFSEFAEPSLSSVPSLAARDSAAAASPGAWTRLVRLAAPSARAVEAALYVALVAAGVLALSTLLRRRGAPAGSFALAETDLAALLGGALQHPSLARLPALRHGRFIPLLEGAGGAAPLSGLGRKRRAMSLHQARRRSVQGKLFSSSAGSHLARQAAARGLTVIDASRSEGRVAALGLAVVDLDEWADLLDRGTSSGLVTFLNEYLDSIGEDWRLVLTSPLARPLKVVDLSRLGLGRRQVLIDPRSAEFAAIGPRLDLRSDVAAFRLLDAVAEHLDLARSERAHLLTELARRAVEEEHGR